jgi:hypothetical protein
MANQHAEEPAMQDEAEDQRRAENKQVAQPVIQYQCCRPE